MASPEITDEMFAAYERLVDLGSSPAQAFDIGWREGVTAERMEIETRFWSIVDRDGLSGLPSDIWAALDILAKNHARKREEVQGSWKTSCPIDGRQCDKVPCPLRIRCEENHH